MALTEGLFGGEFTLSTHVQISENCRAVSHKSANPVSLARRLSILRGVVIDEISEQHVGVESNHRPASLAITSRICPMVSFLLGFGKIFRSD